MDEILLGFSKFSVFKSLVEIVLNLSYIFFPLSNLRSKSFSGIMVSRRDEKERMRAKMKALTFKEH